MIPTLFADINETFWFPKQASTFAPDVDSLYNAIVYISVLFFVPIVAAMIYFSVKYRERPGYKGSIEALHNTTIEVIWSVVPTFIAGWIFWQGLLGYLDMQSPPPSGTEDIKVIAKKWSWNFKYPNGAESPELHVPVGRPSKMIMRSEDVNHGFYVPAFRVKRDIIPGRFHYSWFTPTLEGTYDLFCSEYCGDNHSTMNAKVFVESEEAYAKFLAEAIKEPEDIVERGKWLYERKGCKTCHYAGKEGSAAGPGPSYNGSWGKPVPLVKGADASGKETLFDEEYVLNSIMDPDRQRRKGYEGAGNMQSYKGQLKIEQVEALAAFIKSLESETPPAKK